MRRSGSGCLLLPKEDVLDDNGDNNNKNENNISSNLSVTILGKERLPTFSCERFYLLSEIAMHVGQPLLFLDDLPPCDDNNNTTQQTTTTTVETTTTTMNDHHDKDDDGNNNVFYEKTQQLPDFAPFTILYLFWGPGYTFSNDPEKYVESYVLPTVERLLRELCDNDNTVVSLYLVVDRVLPVTTTTTPTTVDEETTPTKKKCQEEQHGQQEDLAERLARIIASHDKLRSVLHGVTIGVSNHPRAAPGLEMVAQGVSESGAATDRRKYHNANTSSSSGTTDSSKTLLGLVARSTNDMMGLQDPNETDAAQDVLQSTITAEWMGRGTLLSFAGRAHEQWRKDRGLVHGGAASSTTDGSSSPTRKIPRRIGRGIMRNGKPMTTWADLLYDVLYVSLLFGYIAFHFGRDLQNDTWWFQELYRNMTKTN